MHNQIQKQFFYKVLEIVGYQLNKEEFIEMFLDMCEKKALIQYVEHLSNDKKYEFKQKTLWAKGNSRFHEIVRELVDKDLFQKEMQTAALSIFTEFLGNVIPALSSDQCNALQKFLSNSCSVSSSSNNVFVG